MDIGKLMKNVRNLNEYISTTQESSEKCKSSRIQLNMSTVLALKKIRSLEIEYFNKCEENGIACLIFERMLCLPPSKTWGVLCKELVNLLQYWLDAIRKHLVRQHSQWWTFLKLLLRFVKEIRLKDSSLPNILVEQIAECLLDLATNSRPDATQKHEILHCFNMYCSESSREIRFALRNKFGQYFIKLSNYMASCGHLPTQYSIMETLLRWLLPRQDRILRITSAAKWFPSKLYADRDVDIFLERPWLNFFQDARDFLNAHNQRQDLITSVVCRKLTVGKVVIISGTERQESWLDINCVTKCVSVLLDPRVLETFGSSNHKSFETLVVTHDNTHSAKLHKESLQLVLSVRTATPPQVLPSCINLGDDVGCDVSAVITSRCDVRRLDDALRRIFDDKYEILLDLDKDLELSPLRQPEISNKHNGSAEDARFSHPVEVKRRKHSGYIVRSRHQATCQSPSTASTSSLAQLHEKLAALPRYNYDKEPVSVCALPELSIVTEASEADDRQSLNSTIRYKPYGVCYKNRNTLENRKSQSDPENSRKVKTGRRLSPIVNEDTTSCLLVATIGSADDSVINDTVERLSKTKDYNTDNIVDLLVQEALQAKNEKSDSGINTGEKKSNESNDNSETIDNTPDIDKKKVKNIQRKVLNVVSSTSDESNTEVINDTPCYVNTRRKLMKEVPTVPVAKTFDEQVVEEFFSQHFTENKAGEIVISPSLAKKINETSSETSDNLDDNLNLIGEDIEEDIVPYDFNNIEVLECLNSIVDKVCEDFNKCTLFFNKDDEIIPCPDDTVTDDTPLQEIINTIQNIQKEPPKNIKAKKPIKLKYKIASKKTRSRAAQKKNKLEFQSTTKMSTIIEDKGLEAAEEIKKIAPTESKEAEGNNEKNKKDSPVIDTEAKTPPMRRRRKLYSPKDEQILVDDDTHIPDHATVLSDLKTNKTPKSTVTCYKDIEKDRQRYIRMPRTRKSKVPTPPSPRTKKMNDVFDKLQQTVDGEKVTLADKTHEDHMYNFTSDSDDDFKQKKIEISKRNSTTTVGSVESAVSKRGRAVKRINYTDNKSSDESNKTKRKITRKPRTKKKANIEQIDLVDERMRHAKDVLDTSIIVEKTKKNKVVPNLTIETAPEMEVIDDESINKPDGDQKRKGKKIKEEKTESKRPKRGVNKPVDEVVKNVDEDRTESPLPGLVVEPIHMNKDEGNELSSTMVDKLKKIYQDGPENYINESNTTQNMLSDIERINYSPPNVNITEEIIQVEEDQLMEEPKPKEKSEKKNSNSIILKNTKKPINNQSKRSTKKNTEIINISATTEDKSEKSIETIGITGHGDIEEEPPSPKLITERLEPRNLEVEDLDNSIKDYFDKLTKEMNDSNQRDSSGSNEDNTKDKSKSKDSDKSNSPVVHLKRLSSEDISRWLPSRCNTSDGESDVSVKSSVKRGTQKSAAKIFESPKNTAQIFESPKISKSKRDDDSDISENNELRRQSMRLFYKTMQEKLNKTSQPKNNDSDSESSNKSVKVRKIKEKSPLIAKPKEVKTPVTDKKTKVNRKSIISPIKLFEDLISNADKQSETTLSDDEEYMKEIVCTLEKKKRKNVHKSKVEEKTTIHKIPEQKEASKSIDSLSSHSKMSTSTKIDDSRMTLKRRVEGDNEGSRDCKKRVIEMNNNVTFASSGVTVSSVEDWFKRIEPDSGAELVSASVRHSMQNVLEKVDTTLVEIHRNTSKKFVHLFVDAQKHLCELKEQRRGMYKQIATDILREVVKIMDDKFADLDKRSQDLDGEFMKQLKQRASELVREDCQQKRAMVRLLKEDVQAVLDHMERHGANM